MQLLVWQNLVYYYCSSWIGEKSCLIAFFLGGSYCYCYYKASSHCHLLFLLFSNTSRIGRIRTVCVKCYRPHFFICPVTSHVQEKLPGKSSIACISQCYEVMSTSFKESLFLRRHKDHCVFVLIVPLSSKNSTLVTLLLHSL